MLRAWQPQAARPAAQTDASRCRVPIYRARAARNQVPEELLPVGVAYTALKLKCGKIPGRFTVVIGVTARS